MDALTCSLTYSHAYARAPRTHACTHVRTYVRIVGLRINGRMHLRTYMYELTNTHTHTHAHLHVGEPSPKRTHMCTHTHSHTRTHTCAPSHTRMQICAPALYKPELFFKKFRLDCNAYYYMQQICSKKSGNIYIIIRHCPGVGAFPRPFCVPNSVALASLTLQVGDSAIH